MTGFKSALGGWRPQAQSHQKNSQLNGHHTNSVEANSGIDHEKLCLSAMFSLVQNHSEQRAHLNWGKEGEGGIFRYCVINFTRLVGQNTNTSMYIPSPINVLASPLVLLFMFMFTVYS